MRVCLMLALVMLSAGQRVGTAADATAKASAPIDITGYWVALVTAD